MNEKTFIVFSCYLLFGILASCGRALNGKNDNIILEVLFFPLYMIKDLTERGDQ